MLNTIYFVNKQFGFYKSLIIRVFYVKKKIHYLHDEFLALHFNITTL